MSKKRKRLKTYTEDEIIRKYKRAFRIDYVTGILLLQDFKPIGIAKNENGGAWNIYMINHDLVCLWGLGVSDKIPRLSLGVDRQYSERFRTDSRICNSKKERIKVTLNLLKDYYDDILRLEKLSKTEKS